MQSKGDSLEFGEQLKQAVGFHVHQLHESN